MGKDRERERRGCTSCGWVDDIICVWGRWTQSKGVKVEGGQRLDVRGILFENGEGWKARGVVVCMEGWHGVAEVQGV